MSSSSKAKARSSKKAAAAASEQAARDEENLLLLRALEAAKLSREVLEEDIWCKVESHIRARAVDALIPVQCVTAFCTEISTVVKMVGQLLDKDEGGGNVPMVPCSEPLAPPIDSHARGVMPIAASHMIRPHTAPNPLTDSSSSLLAGGCSVQPLTSPKEKRPPIDKCSKKRLSLSTISDFFIMAGGSKSGSITLGELQTFMRYHGHEELAALGCIRLALQALGLQPAKPIELQAFGLYLESIADANPSIEFTAAPIEQSPRKIGAKEEAQELKEILQQKAESNKTKSSARTSSIELLKARRKRASQRGSAAKHKKGGYPESGVIEVLRPQQCEADLESGNTFQAIRASFIIAGSSPKSAGNGRREVSTHPRHQSAATSRMPKRTSSSSGSKGIIASLSRSKSMMSTFVPDARVQPSLARSCSDSLGPGVSVIECLGQKVVATRNNEWKELQGHMSRHLYESVCSISAVDSPEKRAEQSLLLPTLISVPRGAARPLSAPQTLHAKRSQHSAAIQAPRQSLMIKFMAGQLGDDVAPLAGGISRTPSIATHQSAMASTTDSSVSAEYLWNRDFSAPPLKLTRVQGLRPRTVGHLSRRRGQKQF